MNVLLCALRDGRIDVEYLRTLRQRDFNWFNLMPVLAACENKSYPWQSLMQRYWTCIGLSQSAGTTAAELSLFYPNDPAVCLRSTNRVYSLMPETYENAGIVLSESRTLCSEFCENAELEGAA